MIDEVREALDGGQPLDLLGLVSMLILATSPQPALLRQPDVEEPPSLNELVAAFIGVQAQETTALLAVLSELLADEVTSARCRREVDARHDDLPGWLTDLAQTTVHRAVLMTHVLGDADELLLGVRLADGRELTCAVNIDHLMVSEVRDAFFVPETIDAVLTVARASNTDPDTSFVDLGLADARARLQHALDQDLSMFPLAQSDTWPSCRALVQWLVALLPDGGVLVQSRQRDSSGTAETLTRFFASSAGEPYQREHRELLEVCIEDGTGDPLRWSRARVRQLLNGGVAEDDVVPVQVQLDLPDLLRAYIPFAHAESEIRQDLTAETLAAIDEVADDYFASRRSTNMNG